MNNQALADLLAQQKTYRLEVVNRYDPLDLKLLKMKWNTPNYEVRLTDIYVPRRLQLAVRRSNDNVTAKEILVSEALKRNLLILGDPGAGKSTLLRWLAVRFASEGQGTDNIRSASGLLDAIPILVDLGQQLPRDFFSPTFREQPDWLDLLPTLALKVLVHNTIDRAVLDTAIKDGKALFLLDGLDEIANAEVRRSLFTSLVSNAQLWSNNRVVLSSRPSAALDLLTQLPTDFDYATLMPFSPSDIHRFFVTLRSAASATINSNARDPEGDELFQTLSASKDPWAAERLELAQTPLFSAFLLVNEGSENFPERRVELYEKWCQLLLDEWESAHRILRDDALNVHDYLQVLAAIAWHLHSEQHQNERQSSFVPSEPDPELLRTLKQSLAVIAPSQVEKAHQFLNELCVRSGLLQQVTEYSYTFVHSSFREYLAGRYIADQPNVVELIASKVADSHWREPLLLAVARLALRNTKLAGEVFRTILAIPTPPTLFLLPRWLTGHRLDLGRFCPEFQLGRRLGWMLQREYELAVAAYIECPEGTIDEAVMEAVADRGALVLKLMIETPYDQKKLESLASLTRRLLNHQGQLQEQLMILKQMEGTIRRLPRDIADSPPEHSSIIVAGLVHDLLDVQDSSIYQRLSAADALGEIGGSDPISVRALCATLATQHEVMQVQVSAAKSLGRLGSNDQEVISTLLAALMHQEWQLREAAAESLAQLKVDNADVAAQLNLLVADRNEHSKVRLAAIKALARMTNVVATPVSVLIGIISDTNEEVQVRVAAVYELGRLELIGSDKAIYQRDQHLALRILTQRLLDPHEDTQMRQRIALSLSEFSQQSTEVVATLLRALHDNDSGVRIKSAIALGNLARKSDQTRVKTSLIPVASHLSKKLRSDKEAAVRAAAAQALGEMTFDDWRDTKRTLVVLNSCMHSPNADVRSAALASITKILKDRPVPKDGWVTSIPRWLAKSWPSLLLVLLVIVLLLWVISSDDKTIAIISLIIALIPTLFPGWIRQLLQRTTEAQNEAG